MFAFFVNQTHSIKKSTRRIEMGQSENMLACGDAMKLFLVAIKLGAMTSAAIKTFEMVAPLSVLGLVCHETNVVS